MVKDFSVQLADREVDLGQFLICQGDSSISNKIEEALAKRFGNLTPGKDFHTYEYETFGIDDSRKLSATLALKAQAGHYILVLYAETITIEAQNSLLKVLEDIGSGYFLVLVVRNPMILLPTLLSRAFVSLSTFGKHSDSAAIMAKEFMSLPYSERIEKFVKKGSKTDEEKRLERVQLREIIDGSEDLLRGQLVNKEGNIDIFTALHKIRLRLQQGSLPTRLLAEHLALALPSMR